VRLFIYNTEAQEKSETEKAILTAQFTIMIRRLWLGITWPSAIITLVFGVWLATFYNPIPQWLWVKLVFVLVLYGYHFTLQKLYSEEMKGVFRYTSNQLRIWNEVATVLLVAIIMLVSVKQSMSWVWGLIGIFIFILLLMSAIRVYKIIRTKK
jgi:putative membrane protein